MFGALEELTWGFHKCRNLGQHLRNSHGDARPGLPEAPERWPPSVYLVTSCIHHKEIYRNYGGVDACMANLMRPGMYGAYHHISVLGKENAAADTIVDVVGSLCENNDKFAIQRSLPPINRDDLLVIHDAGAHGHAMGFQYNGKLRSAELLLKADGSVEQIRRAETYDDYFATVDFSPFE